MPLDRVDTSKDTDGAPRWTARNAQPPSYVQQLAAAEQIHRETRRRTRGGQRRQAAAQKGTRRPITGHISNYDRGSTSRLVTSRMSLLRSPRNASNSGGFVGEVGQRVCVVVRVLKAAGASAAIFKGTKRNTATCMTTESGSLLVAAAEKGAARGAGKPRADANARCPLHGAPPRLGERFLLQAKVLAHQAGDSRSSEQRHTLVTDVVRRMRCVAHACGMMGPARRG
jgi:hypothetical protein